MNNIINEQLDLYLELIEDVTFTMQQQCSYINYVVNLMNNFVGLGLDNTDNLNEIDGCINKLKDLHNELTVLDLQKYILLRGKK